MKAKRLTAKERAAIAANQAAWSARPQWTATPDKLTDTDLKHRAKATRAFALPATVNVGPAPAPAAPASRVEKAVTRLENNRADAPYSRAGVPRHGLKPGWNLEDSPMALRAETPGTLDDLPAASIARLKRLQTLALGSQVKPLTAAPCNPPTSFEDEKRIPMSFNPPRWKTQKNGKTVEDKWMLYLVRRHVSFTTGAGTEKTWTAVARLKGETITPPTSVAGGSFVNLGLDFTRRWGADKAAELIAFLRFAGE